MTRLKLYVFTFSFLFSAIIQANSLSTAPLIEGAKLVFVTLGYPPEVAALPQPRRRRHRRFASKRRRTRGKSYTELQDRAPLLSFAPAKRHSRQGISSKKGTYWDNAYTDLQKAVNDNLRENNVAFLVASRGEVGSENKGPVLDVSRFGGTRLSIVAGYERFTTMLNQVPANEEGDFPRQPLVLTGGNQRRILKAKFAQMKEIRLFGIEFRDGNADNGSSENRGGALSLNNAYAHLFYTRWRDNRARHGGAIDFGGGTDATFWGSSSFRGNRASDGGAIVGGERAQITFYGPTIFENNRAEFGGAIESVDKTQVMFLGPLNLKNNRATKAGGAIFFQDESMFTFGNETLFYENEAGDNGHSICGHFPDGMGQDRGLEFRAPVLFVRTDARLVLYEKVVPGPLSNEPWEIQKNKIAEISIHNDPSVSEPIVQQIIGSRWIRQSLPRDLENLDISPEQPKAPTCPAKIIADPPAEVVELVPAFV